MSEKVAVVGSRIGADLQMVYDFLVELHGKHPSTILVSGGAEGVDRHAEQTWYGLGGIVHSYRPIQLEREDGLEEWGVEWWDYGAEEILGSAITPLVDEPTWANRKSALVYRSILIAENCDRLVAFYSPGKSPGTQNTVEWAQIIGKKVYEFERSPDARAA